jgi:hypothetical protein
MPKFSNNAIRIRGTNLKLRKWFVCKICNGEGGKKACNSNCMLWKDRRSMTDLRIGRFLYKLIMDDKSVNTTRHHIETPVFFMLYLQEHGFPDINNIQDLETFYKTGDKDKDKKNLEDFIMDYIRYLRDDKVKPRSGSVGVKRKTQDNAVGDLCRLYEVNDVYLDRKKIRRVLGEDTDVDKPYAYSRNQIKKFMLLLKRLTYKAMVAYLASTGARSSSIWDTDVKKDGTHGFLKIKDLRLAIDGLDEVPWEDGPETVMDILKRAYPNIIQNPVYEITVYRGYKQEYQTFCSSEAYDLMNEMLKERKDAGEDVESSIDITNHKLWKERVERLKKEDLQSWMKRNRESPVFRTRFGPTQKNRGQQEIERRQNILNFKALDDGSYTKHLREVRDTDDSLKSTTDGHRIDLIHGFRHFHKITIDDTDGIKPNYSTWLEGRKLDKVEEGYLRGGRLSHKALIEYFKAVDRLTADRTNIVTLENVQLKGTIHHMLAREDVVDSAISNLRSDMTAMKNQLNEKDTATEIMWKYIKTRFSPAELEHIQSDISGSSLPLELKKGLIELPKAKDDQEGQGNS